MCKPQVTLGGNCLLRAEATGFEPVEDASGILPMPVPPGRKRKPRLASEIFTCDVAWSGRFLVVVVK